MDYWGIGYFYLEPCCAQRYHEQQDILTTAQANLTQEEELFGPGSAGKMRKALWHLFDKPSTSIWAKIVTVISMIGILASIGIMIIYSIPFLSPRDEEVSSILHLLV